MGPFDIIYHCKAIQMLKTTNQVTLHLETREIWLHIIFHTFPMGIASACRDKLCTAATVYFLARNKLICSYIFVSTELSCSNYKVKMEPNVAELVN